MTDIPTAKVPPTQPAMPPTKETWEGRAAEREAVLASERRAKALELAIAARVENQTLMETAASFLAYITDGTTS